MMLIGSYVYERRVIRHEHSTQYIRETPTQPVGLMMKTTSHAYEVHEHQKLRCGDRRLQGWCIMRTNYT